jgi:hypothetical protein
MTRNETSPRRRSLFVLAAALACLASGAAAQQKFPGSDKSGAPQVRPGPDEGTSPCIIDPSQIRDMRIDRDVLRVVQTNPLHFTHGAQGGDPRTDFPARRVLRSVEVQKNTETDTATWEQNYRAIGCGFYLHESKRRENIGRELFLAEGTELEGRHGLSLFKKSTAKGHSVTSDWRQTTDLRVFGTPAPLALGSRWGYRQTVKDSNGEVTIYSWECKVTEQHAAAEFLAQLRGNGFVEICNSESSDGSGRTPVASSIKFVVFPEDDRVPFLVTGCKLEWRAASEFHSGLSGQAIVERCTGQQPTRGWLSDLKIPIDPRCKLEIRDAAEFNRSLSGKAYASPCAGTVRFSELPLQAWFVDTIDPAGFRSDPRTRKLLTEIQLSQ